MAGLVCAILSAIEVALDELGEGAGAVADPVLLGGLDFAEGQGSAQWDEHRVVAKPAITAWRPGEGSFDLAAEELGPAIGPGDGKDRNKTRGAVVLAESP